MSRCTHLDQVEILEVPETVAGCEECLAQGMQWVHLRMCQTCGHIGCCDNSPGRHATRPQRHDRPSDHPLRGAQRGLELLLRGRSDVHSALVVTGTPRWTSPRPSTSTV